MASLTMVFLLLTLNISFFNTSIIYFEQVSVSWVFCFYFRGQLHPNPPIIQENHMALKFTKKVNEDPFEGLGSIFEGIAKYCEKRYILTFENFFNLALKILFSLFRGSKSLLR